MISPTIILLTGLCLTFIVSIHAEGTIAKAVKKDARATQGEKPKDEEKAEGEQGKGNDPHETEKRLGGCIRKRYLLRDCNQIVSSIAAKKMGTYIDETRKLQCHTIALPKHCLGGSGEDGDCGCENRHEGKHHSGCNKGHRGRNKQRYSGDIGNSSVFIGGTATHRQPRSNENENKQEGKLNSEEKRGRFSSKENHKGNHGPAGKFNSGEKHGRSSSKENHKGNHGPAGKSNSGEKHGRSSSKENHKGNHGPAGKSNSGEKHGRSSSKENHKGNHGPGGKSNSTEKHGRSSSKENDKGKPRQGGKSNSGEKFDPGHGKNKGSHLGQGGGYHGKRR